ncbi:hypothetical protein LPJ75_006695, partial [Coemansia sp. RSA 2598]
MDFSKLIDTASSAYSKYQGKKDADEHNSYQNNSGGYGGAGYNDNAGPSASQYHGSEYGAQGGGRQHSSADSSGFDINSIASMASKYLGGSGNNQTASHGSSGGSFDVGALASMASNYLGGSGGQGHGNSSGHGNNDLFAGALKMAMGSGGFNQGNAGHTQMQSSYNSIFGSGGGAGNLGEQQHQAMGLAAAYMAYKKFTGGGGGGQNQL